MNIFLIFKYYEILKFGMGDSCLYSRRKSFSSISNNKILDWFTFKAFVDDKINGETDIYAPVQQSGGILLFSCWSVG